MGALENIIQNYHVVKEGGLTHRRHFLNMKEDFRNTWHNRGRYGN